MAVDPDALLQTQWRIATDRNLSEPQKIAAMLESVAHYLAADSAWIIEIDKQHKAIIHYQLKSSDSTDITRDQDKFLAIYAQFERQPAALSVSGVTRSAQSDTGYIAAPIWLGQHAFGFLCFMTAQSTAPPYPPNIANFVELLAAGFSQILLQIHQQQSLQTIALTDALTGLPNRRAAEIRLQEELARVARTGDFFTLSICDLDRFKLINDHYGHKIGDTVLQHAASTLQQQMREGDWIARWGGEEFLIYLHNTNSDQAYQIMDRLRVKYQQTPFDSGNGILELAMSTGITSIRAPLIDLNRALADADSALYEAKNKGRNRVVLHQGGQRSILWHAGEIHSALQNNKVIPAYQPIVDLKTQAVVAEEALARLVNAQGQLIPATDFIDAAEGLQLIQLIDATIAQQTMAHCVRQRNNLNNPNIAHFINLSPQILSRPEMVNNLLHSVKRHCAACDLSVDDEKPLVFEITERQFINDFDQLVEQIKPLIDMGFRLALDDFGSGYSSFLYLAKLPISFLKIEGWMVSNMHLNPKIADMIQAIVDLSRKQNIITIAEHIETAETAKLLMEIGVNWGQGYYFGRPKCAIPEAINN